MPAPATHFRLGVLGLVALVSLLAVAFVLGTEQFQTASIRYDTFFDESVEGLGLGASVKFRGVKIGVVDAIGVAKDHKTIRVQLAVAQAEAERLQLDERAHLLRAQLVSQGITGVKLIDLDFVDPTEAPPPPLAFEPPEHYIPSRPSLLTRVAGNAETLSQRLPVVADQTNRVLSKLERLIDEVTEQHVPARLSAALTDAAAAARDLRQTVHEVTRAQLPARTGRALVNLDAAVTKLHGILDQIGGERGLAASARRATDSLGDAGRRAASSTAILDRTLTSIDEAARSFREFIDALEREPDMLIKGRARRSGR